jgi:hypothetical protein
MALSFTDLFNDNPIYLGLADQGWQSLLVSVNWDVNSFDDRISGSFVATSNVAAVPEPSSIILGTISASLCAGYIRRKRRMNALKKA